MLFKSTLQFDKIAAAAYAFRKLLYTVAKPFYKLHKMWVRHQSLRILSSLSEETLQDIGWPAIVADTRKPIRRKENATVPRKRNSQLIKVSAFMGQLY